MAPRRADHCAGKRERLRLPVRQNQPDPGHKPGDINAFLDDAALSDAPAGERLTAAMQVFMDCIRKSGQPVEKLDKTLIDHHIAELDFQISRQLDAVMHHAEFQKVESRGAA